MTVLPPLDDAAVERHQRFHDRIDRAVAVICVLLVADVASLYLGLVPVPQRKFVRLVLVFGVAVLFALEAWRHLGYGRRAGRFRWTGLTIVACIGALAIGEALHHNYPNVDPTSARSLGVAVLALAVALVCDLREYFTRPS